MSAALVVVEPDDVECPNCGGQGFVSEPLFGRHAVADSIETTCSACHGTGLVPAELVRECEDCTSVYWVEVGGCTHRDLCPTCGPRCRDCSREAAEDLAFEQFRSERAVSR